MKLGNFGSIGKLAGNFKGGLGQLDDLVRLAKGLLCLPVVLSKFSFTDTKNLIKGIGAIAAGMVAGIVNIVAEAVADRINSLVNVVTDAILGPLKLLSGYLSLLKSTIENIKQIGANLRDKLKKAKLKSLDLKSFHFNTQNCAVHAANFLNCVFTIINNQLTKAVLSKLNNPLRKVDSKLAKLQKDISITSFQAGGVMEQYVGRNLRFAEKLTKQLSILTR